MKKDRSKYYQKPPKIGSQTLYESDILSDISLKHWMEFDKNTRNGKGFKVGDFIDIAVNTTAIQIVEFLDKFNKFENIDEVKAECEKYIKEIQNEVKLDDND